ncbi:MAG: biotin/lipoyl-containing protein [Bacteroidota bacterium]
MKTSEFVILNGQKSHKVRFLSDELVAVDGKEHRINAKMVKAGQCSLILDDSAYLIDLVSVNDSEDGIEQELRVGGRTVRLRPQDSRTKLLRAIAKSHSSAGDEFSIRAPMPGLVGRILTSPGARLTAGGGVMILEAMKMENEILCPSPATVKEIKVSSGQGVEKNQILAVLYVE